MCVCVRVMAKYGRIVENEFSASNFVDVTNARMRRRKNESIVLRVA